MNIWKENTLEDLEGGLLKFEIAEEFLTDIKKEFGEGDEEGVKVAELKRLKQGEKTMEKFVQEFRRATRGSRYEGRPLIEEFKRGMSEVIKTKLMDAERPSTSIEQWYECATNLDRYWRKSRRIEERLKR